LLMKKEYSGFFPDVRLMTSRTFRSGRPFLRNVTRLLVNSLYDGSFCHFRNSTPVPEIIVQTLGKFINTDGVPFRCETRRFLRREGDSALPEVATCSRLNAENAFPPLRHVQIKLNDSPLAETPFNSPSEDGLPELPDRIPGWGKVKVFRQLLADRASPRLR